MRPDRHCCVGPGAGFGGPAAGHAGLRAHCRAHDRALGRRASPLRCPPRSLRPSPPRDWPLRCCWPGRPCCCCGGRCARARLRALAGGGDRHPDQLLDIAQERQLVVRAQRDRDAIGAGARGAADAVHVAFRHVRQVEVDDVGDAVDVDAAGGDVGRDQRLDPPLRKSFSARSRWFCDLLPWIASAEMPSLLRPRTTLSAPCLVRVNTRTRSTSFSARMMSDSIFGLCRGRRE